jgi:hypothetical protein
MRVFGSSAAEQFRARGLLAQRKAPPERTGLITPRPHHDVSGPCGHPYGGHQNENPARIPRGGVSGTLMGGFGEFAGLFASSAAGGPFRGSRSLRGWACRLVAVTAIEIGVGDAHPASFIRAGTRVPLPRCLRSVRPGRITGVDVRVDIGLCIGRHHPGVCSTGSGQDLWTRQTGLWLTSTDPGSS